MGFEWITGPQNSTPARDVPSWQNAVDVYLNSIRTPVNNNGENGAYSGSAYLPNALGINEQNFNEPGMRERIASSLGITDFRSTLRMPAFQEKGNALDDAVMTAMLMLVGGAAGGALGGAAEGAGAGAGADSYGNFDMGSGASGTLGSTGGSYGGTSGTLNTLGGGAGGTTAGGGMGEDWLDQLIQESSSWGDSAPSSANSAWGPGPSSDLSRLAESPNLGGNPNLGTYGGGPADYGFPAPDPTGNAAWDAALGQGMGGNLLATTGTDPGIWQKLVEKFGSEAIKAALSGNNPNLLNTLARAVPGIAGAISSAGQSGRLSDLSAQQRGAESARYSDQVAREETRYKEEAARQDAARQQNIALEAARYADETGRQDAAIGRQASDIAGDKAVVAPSQARYEASFQPGFTMSNDPGYTDALNAAGKATLHSLSVGGNPAGSPNAWAQTTTDLYNKTAYPALQKYREQNAATGFTGPYASGASTVRAIPQTITGNITQSIPASLGDPYAGNTLSADPGGQASLASITQGGQTAANIGGAVSDVFNPKSSLEDLIKRVKGAGNIFVVQ